MQSGSCPVMVRVMGIVALASSFAALACGGGDSETDASAGEVNASPPSRMDSPPAAPADPTPPELQLDSGASSPPAAPADPTLRTMWAVDATGMLVSFTNKDTSKVATKALTGIGVGEKLLGIDFRPSDGKLYGLGSSSRLYAIDVATGVASAIGSKAFAPQLVGTAFGFDVNPVADKIRAHSDTDQNLRLDPTMGAATVDGALSFAAGDPNQGQSPNLVATAYTNSVKPAPTATVLYAIDSTRNLLVKLPAPNDGKITTVGALGVDVLDIGGFDIWGKDGALEGYATLTVNETSGGKTTAKTSLYAIDLTKGTAKAISVINHSSALSGLAVQP